MKTKPRFTSMIMSFLVVLTSLATGQVFAQEGMIEEVVVTGSRIARDAGTYVGPMTTLEGERLTEQSTYSLNDALLELPAIGAQGTSRNNSNGGRGASFSGIHQLAPERTLTLYNGKRAVSTIRDSLGLGVDLQSFPVNMIDRVEVLADGASSIYGSDAIAGVINLIPKKDVDGIELSVGGGGPEDGGGKHLDLGVLFGLTGDNGFFTAGLTYVDDGDVDFQDRSWSKIPLLGTLDDDGLELNLVGSGIPPEGRALEAGIIFKPNPDTGESFQAYDTFCLGGGPGSDGSGSIDCILNQGHRFNYNDIPTGVSLINGNKAVNFSGVGEYNLTEGVTGYMTVNLAHRKGRLNFTPLPVQGAAGRFTDLIQVPLDHPLLPADAAAVIQDARNETCSDPDLDPAEQAACFDNPNFQMNWRGLDLGPRVFDYDSNTLSATIGLRGDFLVLDNSWEWDAWMTAGRSELYQVTRGQLNVAKLQTAVDPARCALDDSCPKDSNGDPTLNIFGRSPKSAEEIAYTTFDDQERTNYDMLHFAATVAGELGELPAGAIGLAAGIEWREEKGGVNTSGVVQAGDSGGNFAEPTSGKYHVFELYSEASIPLLSGAPLAEELTLDLAGRYSDYNTFGSKFTYKINTSWAPVDQFRFRGTYATGFRAPNVLELFGGTADTFLSVTDPCSAPIDDSNVQANCTAAGVPAGFVQPAAQLKISAGGNEELNAETSKSYSVGGVWEPEFAPLRVSADWYWVEIKDAIGTPDPVNVINACYNSPGGSLSSPDCDRIGRGAAGDVVRFDLLNENLDVINTSGVDVNTTLTLQMGAGQLELDWLLNWLNEYKETSDTGVVSDRTDKVAGLVSDWAAYPEWRSNLSATYAFGDWSAGIQWRYLDKMDVFDVIEFDNVHTTAKARNYFDLFGTYTLDQWSFHAGVQNVGNAKPPYVPDVSANTSGIYDFLGRYYYARVKFQLM
ncbi:MAG: TonB-dependent receptor [Pseudomonadales bacterium]|jgi:iron complex outermembrane receptor protein